MKVDPKVSGLYEGFFQPTEEKKAKGMKLKLRVDIDGERPMDVISGDLFSNSKKASNYRGSFRFERVEKVKIEPNEIRITGRNGKFHSNLTNFVDIQVIITLDSYPLEATVKYISNAGVESKYLCKYKSGFFRRVQVQHDYEEGVVPFESYNTGDLLSPPSHKSRPIDIADAFAEAGIQIKFLQKKKSFIPHPKGIPGEGSIWTQNELYEAMIEHFRMKEKPQWKLWLFSANEYVISDTMGIMVSHKGKYRRGCAVFQDATGWRTSSEKRTRLFIYIHEMSHCFNLRHPWSGIPADSPKRVAAHSTLSWMNYPWRYYLSEEIRGEEEFWKRFNFQFSDSELIHLRHGFRNDVIFGGDNKKEI